MLDFGEGTALSFFLLIIIITGRPALRGANATSNGMTERRLSCLKQGNGNASPYQMHVLEATACTIYSIFCSHIGRPPAGASKVCAFLTVPVGMHYYSASLSQMGGGESGRGRPPKLRCFKRLKIMRLHKQIWPTPLLGRRAFSETHKHIFCPLPKFCVSHLKKTSCCRL